MFKRTAVLVVSGAVLAGCGAGPEAESQEVVSNLIEAGFPAGDIQVHDGQVFVGNDAHVTLEASRELLQPGEGSKEHFSTTNLVSTSVTKICINPTSAFTSYTRLSQGLDMAIQNYNVLGLRIMFARGPATGCTANITAQTMAGAGGSSGFPSGGRPYGTINIGTGLQSYSVDLNEHVITHELGHAIGIRHTDYYDRSISCGSGAGTEGTAGVGAILIPGTPLSDPNSLFNSCFSSTANGEFSQYDVIALNYLY
ncbi:protease [Archangium sp. Cb G35]|uniref:M57 family metalloprotease n=1 Tax=Archangium sp. Cb G35 TaxID=1920190 RepID=UPI000935B8C9|nr:M57 family metalloprotease [Archangium sp. Cb G35]OJT22086.1 protease [Archangium sp. Cb G35]